MVIVCRGLASYTSAEEEEEKECLLYKLELTGRPVKYGNASTFTKAASKSAKTVGKDSGYKSGGLHCVYGQKDNRIRTGSL